MGSVKVTGSFAFVVLIQCATRCLLANEVGARANLSVAGGTAPPISLEKLYQQLRNQSAKSVAYQFTWMWTAASEGTDFYKTDVDISPECRNTCQASMKLLMAFATNDETDRLAKAVFRETFTKMQTDLSTRPKHPLELFCTEVDRRLRANTNLSPTYVRLKANFTHPSGEPIRKHYLDDVYSWDARHSAAELESVLVPGIVKNLILGEFIYQMNGGAAQNAAYSELARAIVDVAKMEAFNDRVEQIRERVLSEVASDVQNAPQQTRLLFWHDRDPFLPEIMAKFQKYFDEDADLRAELRRAKEAIRFKSHSR